jgi:hypothetical protein
MWMPPLDGMFSNKWFFFIADYYTVLIGLVVGLLSTVLKIIAVIHPGNKTNSIVCLIQGWLYGFPGAKKEEPRKETE